MPQVELHFAPPESPGVRHVSVIKTKSAPYRWSVPLASGCSVVSDRDGLRSTARCNSIYSTVAVIRTWPGLVTQLSARCTDDEDPRCEAGPEVGVVRSSVAQPAARRRRLLQANVRAVFLVIGHIFAPQSPKVLNVQRDYVIKHFATLEPPRIRSSPRIEVIPPNEPQRSMGLRPCLNLVNQIPNSL
jgi:hypothetical protein